MITHNVSIAKPAGKVAKKQNAFSSDMISAVISRISDAWSAAAASNHVTLEELRKTVARYDEVLSDLQDQERLAVEDATIHVKTPIDSLASIITPRKETSADALARAKPVKSLREVLQPKAGEPYLALHEQSQLWLAVLLLPLANLHTIGISATIQSLGLARNIPSCVVYNLDSEQFEWRDGYADGEAFAHKRRFPIAYLLKQNSRTAVRLSGLQLKICGYLMNLLSSLPSLIAMSHELLWKAGQSTALCGLQQEVSAVPWSTMGIAISLIV
ncbi:hypothetical protein QWA68_015161 [Fusarium oxysporum]|nr:hypothetical protein QWA68_015161 [Fusarium oxysporum]